MSDDEAERVIYALLEVAEAQQQAVTEALKALDVRHEELGKEARQASLDHMLSLKKGLETKARDWLSDGVRGRFRKRNLKYVKLPRRAAATDICPA